MAPGGGRLSSHHGFHLGDTLSDAAALAAFAHGHLAFVLWLILYAVTPILVPALWLINRHADPGGAEAHDVRVPKAVRLGLGALGAGLLVFALAGWASPKWDDDRLAMGAIPAYRAGHVRLAEPCWAWVG
jgi:hypothetical protein